MLARDDTQEGDRVYVLGVLLQNLPINLFGLGELTRLVLRDRRIE